MIPVFLATPAAKIGAALGLVTVLSLAYVGWREYQQFLGRQEERAKHYAELLEQQQEATGHYIVREAMKLKTVERTMAEKDRLHARMRLSYQDAVRLENEREPKEVPHAQDTAVIVEPSQDCVVGPGLVRDVNYWTRVLNDTAEERDGAAGGATEQPALSGAGAAP